MQVVHEVTKIQVSFGVICLSQNSFFLNGKHMDRSRGLGWKCTRCSTDMYTSPDSLLSKIVQVQESMRWNMETCCPWPPLPQARQHDARAVVACCPLVMGSDPVQRCLRRIPYRHLRTARRKCSLSSSSRLLLQSVGREGREAWEV